MDNIFFETQIGRLCAQHALNMLLQSQRFQPGDLAQIARDLDDTEREMLAPEARVDFQSQNVDDSGFFSIQVIQMALGQFDLIASSLDRPSHAHLRAQASLGSAYICNLREHWFIIRQFNGHWFILDSLRSGPTEITASYVDVYIAQLLNGGYSIFVVEGDLPLCNADLITDFTPPPSSLTARATNASAPPPLQSKDEDADVARAIELSLSTKTANALGQVLNRQSSQNDDDEAMQKALEASLRDAETDNDEARLIEEAIKRSLCGRAASVDQSGRLAASTSSADASSDRVTPTAPPLSAANVKTERIVPIKVEPADDAKLFDVGNGVSARQNLSNGRSTFAATTRTSTAQFTATNSTTVTQTVDGSDATAAAATTVANAARQDAEKMSRDEEIRQKRLKYFSSLI